MFSIPNNVMVTERTCHRLRNLFSAVESTPVFQSIGSKKWSVDCAELASNSDIQTNYVESGERRQQDWATELKHAIAGIPEMAVFGVVVHDREGLESYPNHVLGRHFTFFVDVETSVTVFTVQGLIST